MVSERLLACDTLLSELRMLDYQTAPEPELVAFMERADERTEPCAEMWHEQASSVGEHAVATHQARQLRFQALLIESAVSDRFDNRFGYCEILDDTFALLFESLSDISGALEDGGLSEADERTLRELLDLDTQALDVFLVHRAENCGDE